MPKTQVLIVSKGHAYNHDAFLAMFADDPDIETTLVEQPAAQVLLRPENVDQYDAILFYDMSGIPNIGLLHDGSNNTGVPPADFEKSMEALLDSGKGIVLLNHGTVSWPNWPLWREIHGSSFMLSGGEVFGEAVLVDLQRLGRGDGGGAFGGIGHGGSRVSRGSLVLRPGLAEKQRRG